MCLLMLVFPTNRFAFARRANVVVYSDTIALEASRLNELALFAISSS